MEQKAVFPIVVDALLFARVYSDSGVDPSLFFMSYKLVSVTYRERERVKLWHSMIYLKGWSEPLTCMPI